MMMAMMGRWRVRGGSLRRQWGLQRCDVRRQDGWGGWYWAEDRGGVEIGGRRACWRDDWLRLCLLRPTYIMNADGWNGWQPRWWFLLLLLLTETTVSVVVGADGRDCGRVCNLHTRCLCKRVANGGCTAVEWARTGHLICWSRGGRPIREHFPGMSFAGASTLFIT